MSKGQAQLFNEKTLTGKKPRCGTCGLPLRCPCKGGVIIGSPKMSRWRRGMGGVLYKRLDERGLASYASEAWMWVFTDDAPPPSDPRVAPLVADIKAIYPT